MWNFVVTVTVTIALVIVRGCLSICRHWVVSSIVGFILTLKGQAFSSILCKNGVQGLNSLFCRIEVSEDQLVAGVDGLVLVHRQSLGEGVDGIEQLRHLVS